MIEIRRKGKSILAFVLAMIVGISATVSVFPNVVLANAEDKVNVNFTSATEGATEKIMIKVDPALENVEVTAIQLPNGTKVLGNEAEYAATENGNYEFKVFYKEVVVSEAEDTAASEMEVEPKVIEGSKVFSYETTLVATTETVAPETAVPEIAEPETTEPETAEPETTEPETAEPKTAALLAAAPETTTVDDFFTFNPTTQTIVGYSSAPSAPKNIVVPEQIAGVDVLHIGDDAFAGQQLKSFVLNNQIQTIGNRAFQNNPEISELVLPTTVTSIGQYAFNGCSGLASMVFPEGVTVLGEGVLSDCTGIRSVTLPANLQEIGPRAFVSNNISVITIPSTVRSIGEGAFQDTGSLKKIDISSKPLGSITGEPWGSRATVLWLDKKEDWLFNKDSGKILKYVGVGTDVIVPHEFNVDGRVYSVTGLADGIFANNTKITSVDMGGLSITKIPWKAFENARNLSNVVIPNSVTRIGERAFKDCGSLKAITLPVGLTSLGSFVFKSCSSLTNITLPAGVTSLEQSAFESCSSLTNITLPAGLTSLESGVFRYCSSLTNITLPAGLTSLGSGAFESCSSLTNITIPGSVGWIQQSTFRDSGITTITLKEGPEAIYSSAFMNTKLQKIVIPNSVREIALDAFQDTKYLKLIDLGSQVSWSNEASWRDGKESISGAPWGSSALILWSDSVVVGDWVVETRSNNIAKYTGTDANVTIPESFSVGGKNISVSSLGSDAFKGNTSIESVIIPNSITSIRSGAFSECSNLTSVTFPQTLRDIGGNAFRNCAKLTNVVLPNKVNYIASGAFRGCKAMTSISLPDALTYLPGDIFRDSGLVEVVVPEGTADIGFGAFRGCLELTKVTLPSKLTNVNSMAFNKTPKLRLINVMSSRADTSIGVKNSQPWGASDDVTVRYLGEFISFTHTIENVKGEYARNVTVNTNIAKGEIVSVVRNDGATIRVGASDWQYTFKVTANGTYIFKAKDSSGDEKVYNIEITDIGKPTLTVSDASITAENAKTITEEELIKLINAKATTIEKGEDFARGTIAISEEDLAKVRALNAPNESVEIKVIATSVTGLTANKKVSISTLGSFPVTFDTKGGNPSPPIQKVTIGEKVTEPTEPAKEGHTFAGWYKEESYTTKWDFANDVMPAKDITLYAHWEYANDAIALIEIPRVIDLKSNGSGELVSKGTVKIIEDINQSLKYKSIIVKATPNIRLSNPDVSDYCDVGVWKADGTKYTDGSQPLIYLHPKGDTYPKQEDFTLKAPKTSLKKKGIYTGNMIFQFSWK